MWMIATKFLWDRIVPALPWIILAAAIIGGYWWQANWHYGRGEAAGKAEVQTLWDRDAAAREAATEALRQAAAAKEAEQARIAQEQETALREQIRIADARARDLARRLRLADAAARRQPGLPEAADPAAGPDGTAGIPGDGGAARARIDAALEEHLAACARDSARLQGWQDWWGRVGNL